MTNLFKTLVPRILTPLSIPSVDTCGCPEYARQSTGQKVHVRVASLPASSLRSPLVSPFSASSSSYHYHHYKSKTSKMFNTAFRRFATTAARPNAKVYISSFLAVPVTYVVLNEPDAFSSSPILKLKNVLAEMNMPIAGADGVDGAPAKHAYGLAWSWPSWGSSKPAAAANNANATTGTTAAVQRKPKDSGKVFVRIAMVSGGRGRDN